MKCITYYIYILHLDGINIEHGLGSIITSFKFKNTINYNLIDLDYLVLQSLFLLTFLLLVSKYLVIVLLIN